MLLFVSMITVVVCWVSKFVFRRWMKTKFLNKLKMYLSFIFVFFIRPTIKRYLFRIYQPAGETKIYTCEPAAGLVAENFFFLKHILRFLFVYIFWCFGESISIIGLLFLSLHQICNFYFLSSVLSTPNSLENQIILSE